MTRVQKFILPVLAGIAVSVGSVAHGGTIFDNLNAQIDGDDVVSTIGPLADSFSTSEATFLVDVKLKLLLMGSPSGTTVVSLLADNSTSPGPVIAQLASISDSSLSSTPTDEDVSGFSPIILNANTRYWIELSSTNGAAAWTWSGDTSGIGVNNEFYYSKTFGVIANDIGFPYQMQVNVSAIPEPSTLALGISGLGILLACRWRAVRQMKRQAI